MTVGIAPQQQTLPQGTDRYRADQRPEYVVPDLVTEVKLLRVARQRARIVAGVVALPAEGEQQQVQSSGDHQHDYQVAQTDFQHPVELELARALQRRRKPGPGGDRQQENQEALVERAPDFEQVAQARAEV